MAQLRIAEGDEGLDQVALDALAKAGTLSTEAAPVGNFPNARKLVLGFANGDDADNAMSAIAQALKVRRAAP